MGSVALAFGLKEKFLHLSLQWEKLFRNPIHPSRGGEDHRLGRQNSKDTTQEFIKQMTERGSAVSNIQGDYVQVLKELEYELESGQVTVTIEGEKIIVEMTEGNTGAQRKK